MEEAQKTFERPFGELIRISVNLRIVEGQMELETDEGKRQELKDTHSQLEKHSISAPNLSVWEDRSKTVL